MGSVEHLEFEETSVGSGDETSLRPRAEIKTLSLLGGDSDGRIDFQDLSYVLASSTHSLRSLDLYFWNGSLGDLTFVNLEHIKYRVPVVVESDDEDEENDGNLQPSAIASMIEELLLAAPSLKSLELDVPPSVGDHLAQHLPPSCFSPTLAHLDLSDICLPPPYLFELVDFLPHRPLRLMLSWWPFARQEDGKAQEDSPNQQRLEQVCQRAGIELEWD